jgi:hypothetical protein
MPVSSFCSFCPGAHSFTSSGPDTLIHFVADVAEIPNVVLPEGHFTHSVDLSLELKNPTAHGVHRMELAEEL